MRRTLPVLMMLAAAGAAAQTSPWYIGASQTVTHESNVYRLPDGVAAPAGIAKSDLISSTALLAGLDQAIGRQRLYGNATLRSSRFQDNSVLDNQGYALRAGVDWATVERWSGRFELEANRSLARFNTDTEIGLLTKKNIEQSHRALLLARVGGAAQLSAEASLEYRAVDYSAVEYEARENRLTTATAGLRWRPRAGLQLGTGLRLTRGEYPRFQPLPGGGFAADRYRREGLDLSAVFEPGGASRLDGRVTLGRTRYDESTQRGFSGATGFATWEWRPTAKTRLVTRLVRDDGQDSYFSGSAFVDGIVDYSRTTTSLSMRAELELSAKIRLNAGLSAGRRDLVRTLPPDALLPATARGREDLTELSFGASWEPTRSLVFGCDLGHERRSARGDLSLPYSAGRFGCYGQIYLR